MPRVCWPNERPLCRLEGNDVSRAMVLVFRTQLRNNPLTLLTDFEELCQRAWTLPLTNQEKDNGPPLLTFLPKGRRADRIDHLIGSAGWLELSVIAGTSHERGNVRLLIGCLDSGDTLDMSTCRRLITLPVELGKRIDAASPDMTEWRNKMARLRLADIERQKDRMPHDQAMCFNDEFALLTAWSSEIQEIWEREVDVLSGKIIEARRAAPRIGQDEELSKAKVSEFTVARTRKRRELRLACFGINVLRQHLIDRWEKCLARTGPMEVIPRHVVRWKVMPRTK